MGCLAFGRSCVCVCWNGIVADPGGRGYDAIVITWMGCRWLEEARLYSSPNMVITLVGNKADAEGR